MPSDEEKRRKSIAYILRRRKRGRKVGANSGEVVKSWAEYSEVNFTPRGAYSTRWRWLLFPAWAVAVAIPWIFMAVYQATFSTHSETLEHEALGPIGWMLVGIAGFLSVAVAAFSIAYIGSSMWRFIQSILPHKNE